MNARTETVTTVQITIVLSEADARAALVDPDALVDEIHQALFDVDASIGHKQLAKPKRKPALAKPPETRKPARAVRGKAGAAVPPHGHQRKTPAPWKCPVCHVTMKRPGLHMRKHPEYLDRPAVGAES